MTALMDFLSTRRHQLATDSWQHVSATVQAVLLATVLSVEPESTTYTRGLTWSAARTVRSITLAELYVSTITPRVISRRLAVDHVAEVRDRRRQAVFQ